MAKTDGPTAIATSFASNLTTSIGFDGVLFDFTKSTPLGNLEVELTFSNGRYHLDVDLNGHSIFGCVPCFCAGTLIATVEGERAVETLAIGDRVITASGAVKPIRWIGRRSYAGRFLAKNAGVMPVVIQAGALGDGLPRRNLRISPLHAMFIDGVLVPAKCLVNGSTIVQERGCQQVDYIHVELDRHDVILAEGAPSETFLDDDSRGMFHNAMDHEQRYGSTVAAGGYCASRVESGFDLDAIRQRLAHSATLAARAA